MDKLSRTVPGSLTPLSASTLISSLGDAQNSTLTALWEAYEAVPVQLRRTGDGRKLSRARYRRAHEFLLPLEPEFPGAWPDFLYGAGIVAQLALSCHLLDVGFPDAWCARYIGLYVARSLAYANATGLGLDCSETARLAEVLSPYSKWNCCSRVEDVRPADDGFTSEQTLALLGSLLHHVGQVTGHGSSRFRVRKA